MSLLAALGFKPKAVVNDNPALIFSRDLAHKLEQSAWDDAADILRDATDEGRDRILYGFAKHPGCMALVAKWAQACPGSATAHLALGATLILTGWEIRGNAYAEHVDQAAWAPFIESMADADEPLRRAASLDPASADPYGWLIHAAIGRGEPAGVLRELFEAALEREPLHWPAHRKYFNVTTDKWGGSHDEMFAFADDCSRKAPAGHILHALVAMAFNDYALATRDGQDAASVQSEDNAARVSAALHAWLDAAPGEAGARLSQLSASASRFALNQFAVACYVTGAHAEAKAVLGALKGEIESLPWNWIARDIKELKNPAYVHDRVAKELARASRG